MSEETETDFEQTLIWAKEEEKLRSTRVEGISTFYLGLGAIFLFIICFFIIIYLNKDRKYDTTPDALDMIQDENNIYDLESEYEEVEIEVEQTPTKQEITT
jgi:hypothetical protein